MISRIDINKNLFFFNIYNKVFFCFESLTFAACVAQEDPHHQATPEQEDRRWLAQYVRHGLNLNQYFTTFDIGRKYSRYCLICVLSRLIASYSGMCRNNRVCVFAALTSSVT